jgi:dynein heavy chain
MLVGPTGGGKTSCYRTLQGALSDLADSKKYENYSYRVKTWIMNPKSITMGQLYGAYNEATREWHDGVLALTVRDAARDTTG